MVLNSYQSAIQNLLCDLKLCRHPYIKSNRYLRNWFRYLPRITCNRSHVTMHSSLTSLPSRTCMSRSLCVRNTGCSNFLFCFVLCGEDGWCQHVLSPRLGGLAAFVYLNALIGLDRVHRLAWLKGPLPEADQGLPFRSFRF